jgi:endonuclease III
MNKAKQIQKILDKLYPNPQIPLVHQDCYTLLVAVLLSAQCTDIKVNKVTPKLFSLADTPYKMVQLSETEIEKILHPLGLSKRKAKAVREMSQQLINNFDGEVPGTFTDLEGLSGVGHKTASVVMLQYFKKYAFPVDTHIHRCATRWGLTEGKNVKQTEEDLQKLFKKEDWEKLHLQIIFFGREYCPARNHNRGECPICKIM